MGAQYRANQRYDSRRYRPDIIIAAIILLMLFAAIGYVIYDLTRNPGVIDDSRNNATLGEVQSTEANFKTIENNLFSLSVPADWVQVNNPEQTHDRKLFYPYRFSAVSKSELGRVIDIYHDDLPNIALDKVQKVTVSDTLDQVIPGEISPRCRDYTEEDESLGGAFVQTKWENLRFLCSMRQSTYIVGAFPNTPLEGVYLQGESAKGQFLFVYQDHTTRPDDTLFTRIIRSFKVK